MMNRRRFFRIALGAVGAGLGLGALKETIKPRRKWATLGDPTPHCGGKIGVSFPSGFEVITRASNGEVIEAGELVYVDGSGGLTGRKPSDRSVPLGRATCASRKDGTLRVVLG